MRSVRPPVVRRARGITSIEFATSLALVAVFAGFLLDRLALYEELAEKTTVDITISQIRDGIRHELIRALLARQTPPLGAMRERNPVTWLAQPPQAYMGEFPTLPAQPHPGAWYYLGRDHELVYVPRHSDHLQLAGDPPPRLRWRLRPAGSAGVAAIEDVRIEAQPPYAWF